MKRNDERHFGEAPSQQAKWDRREVFTLVHVDDFRTACERSNMSNGGASVELPKASYPNPDAADIQVRERTRFSTPGRYAVMTVC